MMSNHKKCFLTGYALRELSVSHTSSAFSNVLIFRFVFTEQTAFEAALSEITASDGAYVINLGIREVEIIGYT